MFTLTTRMTFMFYKSINVKLLVINAVSISHMILVKFNCQLLLQILENKQK